MKIRTRRNLVTTLPVFNESTKLQSSLLNSHRQNEVIIMSRKWYVVIPGLYIIPIEEPLSFSHSSYGLVHKDTPMHQQGRRKFWHFTLPKFLKRGEQHQIESKSPSRKSSSPSPQSHKSSRLPHSSSTAVVQKTSRRPDCTKFKLLEPFENTAAPTIGWLVPAHHSPLINLATITDRDMVPREVSVRS